MDIRKIETIFEMLQAKISNLNGPEEAVDWTSVLWRNYTLLDQKLCFAIHIKSVCVQRFDSVSWRKVSIISCWIKVRISATLRKHRRSSEIRVRNLLGKKQRSKSSNVSKIDGRKKEHNVLSLKTRSFSCPSTMILSIGKEWPEWVLK